jgi:RimJ/RimL family protein N-acetyltransferase
VSAAVLPDGTPVDIRPLTHADREWLGRAVESLTPESRYLRFLSPLKTLDENLLHKLVDEVDGVRHVAVVATIDAEDPAHPRGAVGRYVVMPDEPAVAELAITVTDGLQGRGLGSVVASYLSRHAQLHGITTFAATINTDNRASIRIMLRLGQLARSSVISPGILDLRVLLKAAP